MSPRLPNGLLQLLQSLMTLSLLPESTTSKKPSCSIRSGPSTSFPTRPPPRLVRGVLWCLPYPATTQERCPGAPGLEAESIACLSLAREDVLAEVARLLSCPPTGEWTAQVRPDALGVIAAQIWMSRSGIGWRARREPLMRMPHGSLKQRSSASVAGAYRFALTINLGQHSWHHMDPLRRLSH